MNKSDFIHDVENWSNHRYLLWPALVATNGIVLEMGVGKGSTACLHQYCNDTNRMLISCDSSDEWLQEYKQQYESPIHRFHLISDWEEVYGICPNPDIILVDHAPGERRNIDVAWYANRSKILVLHDTEPIGLGDYRWNNIWHLFKYRCDYKSPGAWTTAVSNIIDVSIFSQELGYNYDPRVDTKSL